jgi:hypothetical protein
MNIKIDQIVDHGQQNERVDLSVVANTDLSHFLIADTTFGEYNRISNKLRHMHWFSAKKVISGDKIILFTRKGIDKSEKINSINTKYYLYWQLDSSVWNDAGDAAVLFQINSWNTTKTR